ncbi:unnamed protein product [Cuscuta epithymum]|uniref:Uncharacterized protein n=1 Tax=Cuscuta epithymum TaxID=186058 RepID=A0AAV0GLN3_9ASTE|nr:unnamed protein product [Cuscuta epithymum]CAH9148892.1 unnamed protein product [Cuscuta epithymum]
MPVRYFCPPQSSLILDKNQPVLLHNFLTSSWAAYPPVLFSLDAHFLFRISTRMGKSPVASKVAEASMNSKGSSSLQAFDVRFSRPSSMKDKDMKKIKSVYGFPESSCWLGWIHGFKIGTCFPLSPLIRGFLELVKMSPTQIMPASIIEDAPSPWSSAREILS